MQLQLLPREITPETVLSVLQQRLGPGNGITAAELAEQITGERNAANERRLRSVIHSLRVDGNAICGIPEVGYHWAATPEDLDRTCRFLVRRLISTARMVAAMKGVAMPDLYGQLGLPLPTEDDQGVIE